MQKNFWQKLKKPIIGLCPMDGVTDEPMRQIQCKIAKPDVVYTEFISVEGFCRKPEAFEKKLAFGENERPIVVQVFGYTPECFKRAITEICKKDFDGIDVNMGCPAKSVLQRGGGGALIGNYKLSEEIIQESLRALREVKREIQLSVKTRIIGEEVANKEWFTFLSQFPLAAITVHGRPLKKGNAGPVNWEEIKTVAKIVKKKKIICLGNGGVRNLVEAEDKCLKYNLDGILIGQAALGNPWVFKKNYLPDKQEILKTILRHGGLAWSFYGGKGYHCVLKHFGWYPQGFKNCKNLKRMLLQTRNLEQLRKVIAELDQD